LNFDFETDYCIVGAGAAGCVVADRLSESGRDRVLVLEAGPSDWHPYIHIPATFLKLVRDPRFSWYFQMEPEPELKGRAQRAPQGKVLGGGSSINGLAFMRGQAAEYDEWVARGCPGWGYKDVLPYFKRIERYEGGDDAYRGRDGPMRVSGASEVHLLTRSFVAAGMELGFPRNDDFNGSAREGVGVIQNNREGRFRSGAAQTYLVRAKRRPNVQVETHALGRRILFEGKRAIGVEFGRGGKRLRVCVRREVVLSCGAIKSPHMLQLSGVGPAELLAAAGIPVLHALPGVGQDLHDHLYTRIAHRVRGTQSMNERTRGWRLAFELAKYAVTGGGIMANATTSGALFCRSRPELANPDVYVAFTPGSYVQQLQLEKEPGMAISVIQSHPESTGTIRARTADPEDDPAIQPNYLSAEIDRRAVVAGLRVVRKLFAAPSLAKWSSHETRPGPSAITDEDLLDFARSAGTPGLHFCSSCRMGTDERAVVTPDLKVRGLEGLRVIDASIMPGCSSGNTHAPVLMIGEKGAAIMLKERSAA